jgi:aminomethyltransferase
MKILNTPLVNEHLKLGAKMIPFAGWNMPIQYTSIIEETKYTRREASVFDICHMGEIFVKENPENSTFDTAITIPVLKMKIGLCKYGFLLNENGTVIDDLIIYRLAEDEWMLVVNASNIRKDFEIIKKRAQGAEVIDKSEVTAKLDIQGPKSWEVMSEIVDGKLKSMNFYNFDRFDIFSGNYIISRTGYTGELGYEIYMKSSECIEFWKLLLSKGAKPAGFGARDILRLEAGLPLYGNEFNENITPLEAGWERVLDFDKEFIGRDALNIQKQEGLSKKLIGLVIDGRRTPRHGNKIILNDKEIGYITSGVFSPHLNCGIGMGYIPVNVSEKEFEIDLERAKVKAKINNLPFIKNTSFRVKL